MRVALIFLLLSVKFLNAQQYIQKQFAFTVDSNVVYASDTNYLGYPENLTMHIYKPLGDNNNKRPILIYIHGGSWLGGTPNDYYPSQISEEFVSRGYVVANIQYRLGMHSNPSITPGINCPITAGDAKCAYISDTAEVLRALFRAIQDGKSAIRFMKARSLQDSTCPDALFVSGESAGAFTALGCGLLDKQSERFDACSALSNAPSTNASLASCQNLFNHLPTGQIPNYNRPDLGSIDGKTNLNGQNTNVKGIAAFYGAVFTEGLSKNWINGVDTPFIYMFHQGNDFVVGCGTTPPITPMNQCFPYINFGINDCVAFSNIPIAHGSCDIAAYLQSIGYTNYKFEFINNWIGNGLVDCYNTSQPGQGHNIDYVSVRCDSVAKQFAPIAINTIQNCMAVNIAGSQKKSISIYPNPAANTLYIHSPKNEKYRAKILNTQGQLIQEYSNTTSIDISTFDSGIYFIEIFSNNQALVFKFLKQ